MKTFRDIIESTSKISVVKVGKFSNDLWYVTKDGERIGSLTDAGEDDDRTTYAFQSDRGIKPEFDDWNPSLEKLLRSIEGKYKWKHLKI